MRSFILGILPGVCFKETVTALSKDYLGYSPQQQQYDLFWKRQQRFDMEHMWK